MLAANPDNVDARVQLGRVLSWNGELNQAIDEAEKSWKQAPDNREALQVKATPLQWKGELRQAIPIYQQLVQTQDDFDSRIGLSVSSRRWQTVRAPTKQAGSAASHCQPAESFHKVPGYIRSNDEA